MVNSAAWLQKKRRLQEKNNECLAPFIYRHKLKLGHIFLFVSSFFEGSSQKKGKRLLGYYEGCQELYNNLHKKEIEMETLKNILDNLKITSEKELKIYIDDNYTNQGGIPLKIMKTSDLTLDSENRIYDTEIVYKKTIFDIDKLNILDSSNIFFQDCIFTGSLRVSNQNIDIPTEIFLDTVIVKKELLVSGAFNISKCTISRVNCPEFNILNNEVISELSVSSCDIGLMIIFNNTINIFDTIFNRIEHFESSYNEFGKVSFPNGQINISNHKIIIKESKKEHIKKKHNYMSFNNKLNYEKINKKERLKVVNETSRFLLSHSDYHLNRSDQARLKYIYGLSSISNPFKRVLYQICGGLIIPYRIVLLMLIIIIIFSFFYYCSGINFNIYNTIRPLSFGESVYFSGISFTTIGYGDIAPFKIIRYISIIEGGLGILLSGTFLVSLTRKYIN